MSIKKQKEFLNVDNESFEVTTYEKINILKSLLDEQSYTKYYKCLAFVIGVRETIILQDLISKDNYFNGNNSDWFFNTAENIYYDTAIPKDSQKRLIDNLLENNLIQIKYEGMPRRKYYRVNYNVLKDIMYEGIQLREGFHSVQSKCRNKLSHFNGSSSVILTDNNKNNINKNKTLSKDNVKGFDKTLSFEKSFEITQYFINSFYEKMKILKPKCKKDTFYNDKEVYIINDLVKKYRNGFNKLSYHKLKSFIKEKDIPFNVNEGFKNANLLEDYFNEAIKIYDTNYAPDNKSKLPYKTSQFLLNQSKQTIFVSYFLYYAYNPPKKLKEEVKKRKSRYPMITQKYIDFFNEYTDLLKSIDNHNKLIIYIEKIIKEHHKIVKKEVKVNDKTYFRHEFENDSFDLYLFCSDSFIDIHLEYLKTNIESNDKFSLNLNKIWVGGHWWELFVEWFERNYEIKVYPDDEYLINKCDTYLFKKSKEDF